MNTKLITAAVIGILLMIDASGAFAQSENWSFSTFKPQTFEVGTATNKSGHRMMVLRMKDGTMMAVVPATPLWDLMKNTPDSMLQ